MIIEDTVEMGTGNADNLPIAKSSIEDIEACRNASIKMQMQALELYLEAQEKHDEARKYLNRCGVTPPSDSITFSGAYNVSIPVWGHSDDFYNKPEHLEAARTSIEKSVDRAAWSYIMEATQIGKVMDAEAKKELRQSILDDVIPATAENIYATLDQLAASSHDYFLRGIANVFGKLDRRFRSHTGFKFESRIVLNYAVEEFGNYIKHDRRDMIRDVERVFYVLEGKEMPEYTEGITGKFAAANDGLSRKQTLVEDEYFRLRSFKNGNLHLWFKRKDLLRQVNRYLADYYGEVLGEGADVASTDEMGPGYHVTPARNFGFFPTSDETADKVVEKVKRIKVAYHREPVRTTRILEPSAGQGALLEALNRSYGTEYYKPMVDMQCTAVEIQADNCAVLARKGIPAIQADFLTLSPEDIGLFDLVIMNPPFDRGRDIDHVTHAMQFVRPGGQLLAIMSARAEFGEDRRHKAFHAKIAKWKGECRWESEVRFHDLPAGSFKHAGTNVNTVILSIFKPE